MIIRIFGHDFHYECENLCRVFYPNEKINIAYDNVGEDDKTVVTRFEGEKVFADVTIGDERRSLEAETDEENAELNLAKLIFAALSDITGYTPPWGVLTGVRPSKLMHKLTSLYGEDGAADYFKNSLLVSESKTKLAQAVAKAENAIIAESRPDSFSLYVSIPFCPSRCSYCSFVSHSIANSNAKKLLPEYVEKLREEIALTGRIAAENKLHLESIYFGGGTPGVLEASNIDTLMSEIERSFDLSALREYTVEIGRPDTVTPEKLAMMRFHNVGRISINPQTFNQETLDTIGRKHTVRQAVDAYRLARGYGFSCINMDLIAGLPGEDEKIFRDSLDTAVSLSPENITVHSLALKRSSGLNYEGEQVRTDNEAKKMLDYSYNKLTQAGYLPYYMYRQSKCVGNLENTGWCRPGTEGRYNVYMMEECHTVLGVGAGAVTKLCEPGGSNVERIFNYKYPYEYISGFDVISDRKSGVTEFYLRKGVK